MKLNYGWCVCISFVVVYTVVLGVMIAFAEILIPMSRECDQRLSVLGKCTRSTTRSLQFATYQDQEHRAYCSHFT